MILFLREVKMAAKTLVSLISLILAVAGSGAKKAEATHIWREDFTTGINQSYEANPFNNWGVDSGFLNARDFANCSGRLNIFFKDNIYSAEDNYICSTLFDRNIWNSELDSPGIIFNASSLDDFYYFTISAKEGSINQWWVGHHTPGSNINIAHGISDLISTGSPNKLTVEVSPTGTQFYINDNFLANARAIETGYRGYIGLTVGDSASAGFPQATTSFDYVQSIPEPATVALLGLGFGSLALSKKKK